METLKQLIDKLEQEQTLSSEELIRLLREYEDQDLQNYLFEKSRAIRHHYYGNDVYIRGLIEFTNYCKNDCYYCGIRKSTQYQPLSPYQGRHPFVLRFRL